MTPIFVGIFHSGFFLTDDANWMVIRLSAFYEALRQGQFPVRFLPRLNNSFGYPVADFLYPLFLYLGSFIHAFHINFILSVKVLFAFSLIASAIGSFLWLKKLFGTTAGFIGALIYTLFPYHLWDITKRGSLGEVLAMGIVPFIFWQIEGTNLYLTAIGIGLLILAHNTLALLFLPIIGGYMLLTHKVKLGIVSFLLGLGFSSFFWVPALYDLQYTVFAKTPVSDFSQYFLSTQLYSLIGVISVIVILFASSLRKKEKYFLFFFSITLISIIFSTKISLLSWQMLHLGNLVQFPFRFLSITALGVGFLASFSIFHWQRKYKSIAVCLLVILLYFSSWQYFFPHVYQNYPDTFYSTNQDTTTVKNEYMPIWVKNLPTGQQQKFQITKGIITNSVDRGSVLSFTTDASESASVTVATVYFPGWKVFTDGKEVRIDTKTSSGFITFVTPSGKHDYKVLFTETPIRLIADMVSLVSILILLALIFIRVIRLKR